MSKKALIEVKEESVYFSIISDYAEKRDLSFTGAAKQLLFEKLDEMEKEEQGKDINALIEALRSSQATSPTKQEPVNNVVDEKAKQKPKPKKNMMKNLQNLKR